MRLDIQRLFAGDISALDFDFSFPLTVLDDVRDAKARVVGSVRNHGGYVELRAETVIRGKGVCARCCEEFPLDFRFSTLRPVAKAPSDSAQADYVAADSAQADYVAADGDGFLSLQPVFEEEAALQFPSKLLCRDDCKGLCPVCGANLNEKSCACSAREPDARLEILKKLL